MRRDRFFVLPYSLHGAHKQSFMGRLVLDPLDPLRRFIPHEYEKEGPQTIVPDIAGDPIAYKSRADVIRSASTTSLELLMTAYFKLCGRASRDETVSSFGELVERYQMIQNEARFEQLMASVPFAQEAKALMAKASLGKVYMVVGFLTTKGTRWELEGSQSRLASARARVPAGTASGATADLDVAGEFSHAGSVEQRTTATTEQEEIFAVAYDVIKPKRKFSFLSSAPSQPVLGGAKRVRGGHLALGARDKDEDDDDVSDDDDEGNNAGKNNPFFLDTGGEEIEQAEQAYVE